MSIVAHSPTRGIANDDRANTEATHTVGEGADLAKEWWVALLQAITPRVVRLGTGEDACAEGGVTRREGDGKLTFEVASLDAPEDVGASKAGDATEGSGASSPIGRMRLELDGGRLGTVYLTVERHGTAVSVVVGVADPIQRAIVELELGSLTQALRAAGLNVGSVRVLHPEAAGTAFAQGRRGMTFQSSESVSSAYRNNRTRQQPDADEGLDVVG